MSEHPSFVVFGLLPRFFASRGLTPASASPSSETARDRFVTELRHVGYFRANATDADDRLVVVLLLAPGGKYADRGPQLRTLLSSLETEAAAKAGRLAEVLVVVPGEVMEKGNMTGVIHEFRARAAAKGRGAPAYAMHPYHVFSLDVPGARCVPRHEIVPSAEAEGILARERLAGRDLKTMLTSSPPVVWVGGRPGEVVRTVAPSETAGEAYDYWLLKRDPSGTA